jgi:hypothetical protein
VIELCFRCHATAAVHPECRRKQARFRWVFRSSAQ